jgi:alkylhydroperoxidase family enzyme
MKYLPISKLPVMAEETATGEIAETFDEIRTVLGIPSVGVGDLAAASSPATLISKTRLLHDFIERATLPQPLLFMIHYTISSAKNCKSCSATLKVACRSVGVDEEMLEALVKDLDAVKPQRLREIIKFAVNCALNPQGLTEADYDRVRDQGVSEEELLEIVAWAALAMYNNTLADAMKMDDPVRQQVLEGLID